VTAARLPLRSVVLAALFVGAAASWFASGYFGKDLLAEVAILALFAMSLDLLVGYTGLVSLGHAAFFGIGAYGMAIGNALLGWDPWAAMALAASAAAAVALVVGAFAVRLKGVFFIMITLAIGQMVHAYFFRSDAFGGDDGMGGIARVDLAWIGLAADDPGHFALFALFVALIGFVALDLIVRSPFGRVLVAIHQNEGRARALGCPVLRYKLGAYVVAAAFAGLAGALAAQRDYFVSPEFLTWTVSGEVLIVVIVGGMGSLLGPAVGAAVIVLLRHHLSDLTHYWMFFLGLFFIAVVLFAENGIYGALRRLVRRRTLSLAA